MKTAICLKISVLFALAICFNSAFSQTSNRIKSLNSGLFEWTEMPSYNSSINTSLSTADGGWVLGGSIWNTLSFLMPPVVIKLSSTGEKMWQYPHGNFQWEVGITSVVKPSNDGNLLVAGWCMMGCDFTPSGVFLHKISQDGYEIWENIYVTNTGGYSSGSDVLETQGGDIFLIMEHQLLKVSSVGDSLTMVNYSMSYSDNFTSGFADDDFLLLGHSTGIFKTDFEGNILETYNFDGSIKNIYKTGTSYNFISGHQLIKTDFELNVVNSYDFSAQIPGEFNSTVSNDELIITGNGHIMQFDADLQLLSDQLFETPESFNVRTIAANDSLILMAGTEVGCAQDWAMAAKTFNLDGSTQEFGVDAGIVRMRVENAIAVPSYAPGVYDFYWFGFATVRNFGTEPINTVDLIADLFWQYICSSWYYLIPQDNILLNPGDSVEFSLGQMVDWTLYYPGQTSAEYTWKMHSRLPNGLMDMNPSNDEASDTFHVDLTVGIDDDGTKAIKFFPNPASEDVTIEFPDINGFQWIIRSITGQSLETGFSDHEFTICDVSNLPSGLYFLEIMKDGRLVKVEKLMIGK